MLKDRPYSLWGSGFGFPCRQTVWCVPQTCLQLPLPPFSDSLCMLRAISQEKFKALTRDFTELSPGPALVGHLLDGSEDTRLLASVGDPHLWSLNFRGFHLRRITGGSLRKGWQNHPVTRLLSVGEKPPRGKWWIEGSIRPSPTFTDFCKKWVLEYHLQLYLCECVLGLGLTL